MAFPPGFLFGTANADHQVEAHDPQHEDVWDLWERCQGLTPRGNATDFWHRYPEDIAAAAAIGCKLFRFSVAWARVETSDGHFDSQALAHYRQLAQTIRDHGMKVMITLHHFVWPVWLERDHGGMIGPDFPDIFARYAQKLASSLGDLIDYWITFNEPSQLTFGYIKPWWHNRYYMPPGLPRGSNVEAEAEAVGKLIPNLFLAHARARHAIRLIHPHAPVGVNPLVTGFPPWLQMLMDWGACHRSVGEALFKFTNRSALISEKGDLDLVIGGITPASHTRFEMSDPYLLTSKAILVKSDSQLHSIASLAKLKIAVIAIGNQPESWEKDLPSNSTKKIFPNYTEARTALLQGLVDAVYGDAFFLMPQAPAEAANLRFLATGLSVEPYSVAAPHGHHHLIDLVNRAIATLENTPPTAPTTYPPPRPLSLSEVLTGQTHPDPQKNREPRGLRRIRKRGKIRIGIRSDTPDPHGIELLLAQRIAQHIFGHESALEIVKIQPTNRLKHLQTKSRWLNWAWRFWGTTTLIANANWWYLGTSGRLSPKLCPPEAIGAQDFIGLDYYWGLPTWKLGNFRSLEDAAHGRFLKAPVWPLGLFHALQRFHRWFPEQEIFIVENGSVPVANGIPRDQYLREHLAQVEHALENGVPIKGYNFWSITSNREWGHPFDPNTDFGLFFVDLDKDPTLKRFPSNEVETYRTLIRELSPRPPH